MGLRFIIFLVASLVSFCSLAEEINQPRAKFNYQMFCQGCHAPDGAGHKSVPQLKNSMHRFMASQAGREYLVKVPGAANSVLDDMQLAEVLNWMLAEFSNPDQSKNWQPYEANEVASYRTQPLLETIDYRRALLASLTKESDYEKAN